MTFVPPALETQGLRVAFLRDRGVLGVLMLNQTVAQLARWVGVKDAFEAQVICESLSIKVPKGAIFGLFGVNGAGKSSVMRAISGLEPPGSGAVFVHGLDASKMASTALASIVSRGNREFASEFTVLDNMELIARLYQLAVGPARDAATMLLKLLGVTEEDIAKVPGQLSLGSQGKVAVVRALLPLLAARVEGAQAPILLLDEPTLGFDPVAVEQFFEALRTLKRSIPDLTIVIATNDPREMSICTDFIALVKGHAEHDGGQFEQLKGAMATYGNGIRAAAAIIGRPIAAVSVDECEQPFELPVIPRTSAPASKALTWRHWHDMRQSKVLAFMVALSMVVPNLTALFASGREPWHGLILGTLAVFTTLLIREAYRFLGRERDYFNTLETLLMAPITRREHFLVTARNAILTQCINTLVFMGGLGLMLFGKLQPGLKDLPSLDAGIVAALLLVFMGVIVTCYAVGLISSLVPFATKSPVFSYFFMGLLPVVTVTCGGIFYEVAKLPPGLSQLAQLNPLSYGALAITETLQLKPTQPLPLTRLIGEQFPYLGNFCVNIVAMFMLAVPAFVVSAMAYAKLEPYLRQAGRLRNLKG